MNKIEKQAIIYKYFTENKGYKRIAKEMNLSRDSVRSFVKRYKLKNGLEIELSIPISMTKPNTYEKRISELEMNVELLKNFLYWAGRR